MLVIKIELWPHGDPKFAKPLGVAHLWNDGSGEYENGNYQIEIKKTGGGLWKKGAVRGFPRTRLGPWDLLYRALKSAVGKRNQIMNNDQNQSEAPEGTQ